MIETRASRLTTLCILFGLLGLLAFGFGLSASQGPWPGQSPDVDHISPSDDTYVGQQVQVSGTVVRTDPVVIAAEYEYWTGTRYRTGVLEFTITGLETTVSPGQHLQVYGVLASARTVEASNGVFVPAGNIVFMYGVSALTGTWVLARLVRGWTVDWGTFALEPRPEPLVTLVALGPRGSEPEESEDSTDA